jgi:hypothetical protein
MCNNKELIKALNADRWKASNRGGPHEYILSRDYPDLVKQVQKMIAKEGKSIEYRNYRYKTWYAEDKRYWVMPGISQLPPTFVLNRCLVEATDFSDDDKEGKSP